MYLVGVGPECANSQLRLHPTLSCGRRIPDRVALGTAIHLDVNVEGSRAGAIATGQGVMEVNAVSVILLKRREEQVGLLSRGTSRGIDHHEGPCQDISKGGKREKSEVWVLLSYTCSGGSTSPTAGVPLKVLEFTARFSLIRFL